MAKHKKYTRIETEYIARVAGRVPVTAIAQLLRRTVNSVNRHAYMHGISLRVPKHILDKYWRDNETGQATM